MDWFLYDNGLRLERVKAGEGGVVKKEIINLNVKKSSMGLLFRYIKRRIL